MVSKVFNQTKLISNHEWKVLVLDTVTNIDASKDRGVGTGVGCKSWPESVSKKNHSLVDFISLHSPGFFRRNFNRVEELWVENIIFAGLQVLLFLLHVWS